MKDTKLRLPLYGSMKQCSGETGIPLAILKQAKASGCPAFKSNQTVNLGDFLQWFFSRDDDESDIHWGNKLNEYKAKREKLKLKKDERESLDRGEVQHAIGQHLSRVFDTIRKETCNEFPARCKGLDEIAIQQRALEMVNRLETECRAQLDALTKEQSA